MSEGLNRVTLFGNLGADPELRRLPSGTSLLRMRLATNHTFVNKEGVREERTEWHSVVLWGPRAEGLSRFLSKGSGLIIEGQLRTSSYDKDGDKRYSTEIHADNVIFAGRRGTADHRRDDDAEPLPFGLTTADLREPGERLDDPAERPEPDEPHDRRELDLVPRDQEPRVLHTQGVASAEAPAPGGPSAPGHLGDPAAERSHPAQGPRSDSGSTLDLPLMPPHGPRKKSRSSGSAPAMVAA